MHLPTVCCAVLCCEEADGVKGAAMYVSPASWPLCYVEEIAGWCGS